MKEWYFVIDVEKCENCQNCFLACKDEHVGNEWPGYAASMPDESPAWISVRAKERGRYPFIDVAYLPTPCMHCANAPCLDAAKDGAVFRRPDGVVLIDPIKAKGRKDLAGTCPYGAINWNEDLQLPQKCTFCAHLLDRGWVQTRCSQSCPTGAITVRNTEREEMRELAEKNKLETYQPEVGTGPRAYYGHLGHFSKCFIGGSVAIRINGRDECAQGVVATLFTTEGAEIAEQMTDNYGDFKFDNLEANGKKHSVKLALQGYQPTTLVVELKESAYLGVIFLSQL